MDVTYSCNACCARGGIRVEVEVDVYLLDVGPEDVGPEDYQQPAPWQAVPYSPMMSWQGHGTPRTA
jgi:hypothetical protein